ncbi:MAG: type II secretion system minor pseudopilin GspK [Gammaproteobacteria bacterium]|nr:type II secretion system minor pseudopilin GspK [Gammaproteobacteria bacterium]
MNLNTSQKGVALVTALLVVSIAVVLAAELVDQLHFDTRRTENMLHNEQAYLYTLAAEDLALRTLRDDLNQSKYDSLDENWAIELPPMPVEGGSIAGKLVDLQARFNLNNLSKELNNNYTQAVAQFRRLLQNLGIDPGLADGVVDWLDKDLETTIPNGAEDDFYMGLTKPYRTANGLMTSASELRMVKGFNEQNPDGNNIYKLLENYVVALPQVTMININTAPAEVLESLSDDITEQDAKSIIEHIGADPENDLDEAQAFETIGDFQKYMKDELKKQNFTTENMSVASEYFQLVSFATIGRGQLFLYSTIQRSKTDSRVIQRSQGAW